MLGQIAANANLDGPVMMIALLPVLLSSFALFGAALAVAGRQWQEGRWLAVLHAEAPEEPAWIGELMREMDDEAPIRFPKERLDALAALPPAASIGEALSRAADFLSEDPPGADLLDPDIALAAALPTAVSASVDYLFDFSDARWG